ncbi:hypothetical protein PpBr36_01810 [Pyricularia pennisetigena]|uniref:hypothetical protein n=1 Tax=Pyricularia pennisetigena TaxID=1578925 RepID=UPI001154296A|nr:hypothetical protein PpBr36_01810 [Pyricularia pennisetigena]TLS28549.1 hypothetical protein PpBr36_01810 [Pyricularia pennisetigena]
MDKRKAHFTPTHDFVFSPPPLTLNSRKDRVSGLGVGHGSDLTVRADYLGSEGDGRIARVAARLKNQGITAGSEVRVRSSRGSKDRPGREGKVGRPTLVVSGWQGQRTNAAQWDGRGAGKRSTVPGRTVCAGKRDNVRGNLIRKVHTRKRDIGYYR